jgi:16S rRNA (cytosine967-C5)-methyltransferase
MMVVGPGRSLDEALSIVLDKAANMDDRDRALCRALAFGVCRWYFALRPVIAGYLKKPFKQKDKDLEMILLMGLYQIVIMEVDHHAAVNETVKLTLQQNKSWAKGLVNAVLRGIVRDEVLISEDFAQNSYPKWFYDQVSNDWPDQVESILAAGNDRAPMSLRLDTRQLAMNDYLQRLADQSIGANTHELVSSAVVLDKPCSVDQLPGFACGAVSVQDPAAQLAATLLDCEPQMRVLDACAAPGGKTMHLLQSTDELKLVALDQDKSRLELIAEDLKRVRRSAQLICGDASNPEDWFEGQLFDRILADLPCSGSGVVRRHPDIKLLRRASDIDKLIDLQRSILAAIWPLLKPGGILLYSTCSIFKDENERQIERFVQSHENAELIGPKSVQWGDQRPGGCQILPGTHNMDGFFYACLRKSA